MQLKRRLLQMLKPLYFQYAKLEEDFGLAKRAMKVYDQATKAVPDNEKMSMYEIYNAWATEIVGFPKTREIYEQAIESDLPEKDVKTMCMQYAELEKSWEKLIVLGGSVFASQFADPQSDADFWNKWHEFEVQHGNEDTFREMLRIKRSVSASYSQTYFILPEYLIQKDHKLNLVDTVDTLKRAGIPEDEMADLERQLAPETVETPISVGVRKLGFVSAGVELELGVAVNGRRDAMVNPEDIELPEEDESDEEKAEIAQKEVPAAVFGELAKTAE